MWKAGVAITLSVYAAAAWWAKSTYHDPAPEGALAQLHGPYAYEGGMAWRAGQQSTEDAGRLSGDVVIYEERQPLVRAESFVETRDQFGRFLGEGSIIFSTSDGSDPNHNGRRYWAVAPKKVPEAQTSK